MYLPPVKKAVLLQSAQFPTCHVSGHTEVSDFKPQYHISHFHKACTTSGDLRSRLPHKIPKTRSPSCLVLGSHHEGDHSSVPHLHPMGCRMASLILQCHFKNPFHKEENIESTKHSNCFLSIVIYFGVKPKCLWNEMEN